MWELASNYGPHNTMCVCVLGTGPERAVWWNTKLSSRQAFQIEKRTIMKLKSNYLCSQMLSSYRPRRTLTAVQVMPLVQGPSSLVLDIGITRDQVRTVPVAEPFISSPSPGCPYRMGFKQVAPLAPSVCVDLAHLHQSSRAFLPVSVCLTADQLQTE